MSDSNATELRECPFCGKKQAIYKEFGGWILNTTSHDRKCIMRKLLSFGMAGGLVFDTKAEAIEAWNTRMPEQAIAATLGTDDGSRWFELFGTPERAVQTIAKLGNQYPCDENTVEDCEEECPLHHAPCRLNRKKPMESPLLEWLRGKAVKR